MAAKYFCDACGGEIKESANRTSFTVNKANEGWPFSEISVEVMVSIKGTTNYGHICVPCVQHVVSDGVPTRKKYR